MWLRGSTSLIRSAHTPRCGRRGAASTRRRESTNCRPKTVSRIFYRPCALPVTVPRAWDQRDTATFNLDYRLGARWNFDVAGVYHSGWPTTPIGGVFIRNVFHTVLGAYNSDRLPAYRRVDLRASHNIN